jgi:hypothetical protein
MIKSIPSKLLKLKKWLILPDVARHLSGVCGEEVTEADILQFALVEQLALSVNLVNDTIAIPCRIVHYKKADLDAAIEKGVYPEELKWEAMPAEIAEHLGKSEREMVLACHRINEDQYLIHENYALSITGVWDLSMIGNEWIDVKRKYQNLTGGPAVTSQLRCLDGIFLKGLDGQLLQVQRTSDDIEYQDGSRAQLEKLKQHITNNNIGEKEAEELLSQHSKKRMEFFEMVASTSAFDDSYPMYGLPQDSTLVVRTEALRNFEQLIADNEPDINATTNGNTKPAIIQCVNDSDKQSKYLLLLIAASERFWGNADRKERDTHPINEDVRKWLVDRGLSKRLADTGATIIRPEWAGKGRKPE